MIRSGPSFFKVASSLFHEDGWDYNRINTLGSALASVFDIRDPSGASFSENKWVQQARASAKQGRAKVTRKDRVSGSYFSISLIFSRVQDWGSDKDMSLERLRLKTIVLWRLDGINRSADLAMVVRSSISFSKKGMSFHMWWTKEERHKKLVLASFDHCHSNKLTCSVCSTRNLLARLPPPDKVEPSLSVRTTTSDSVTDQAEVALFISLKPDRHSGLFKALSSERISKVLHEEAQELGIDPKRWRSHDVRGASSSKLFNLGFEWPRIAERARWSGFSTFKQHYFRKKVYRKRPKNTAVLSLEEGLRLDSDEEECDVSKQASIAVDIRGFFGNSSTSR
jgi:hypothetical protein